MNLYKFTFKGVSSIASNDTYKGWVNANIRYQSHSKGWKSQIIIASSEFSKASM